MSGVVAGEVVVVGGVVVVVGGVAVVVGGVAVVVTPDKTYYYDYYHYSQLLIWNGRILLEFYLF